MSTTLLHKKEGSRESLDSLSAPITSRQRFLNACHCQPVDRSPIWLMRQAGRALPEYRALKEKYTFLELVQNPELAVEVTLQPIRRFGFDAAILFSDILVIPEAMGQGYRFRETGGLAMDFAVQSPADIKKLSVEHVVERLAYVDKALRLLRKELGDRTALLGFSGSPWTLATFMMEGGSAGKYTRALALFREKPDTFCALMEKLTQAVTAYLKMQIEAGVDAVQIFDSHGGLLSHKEFQAASAHWMREIISELSNSAHTQKAPNNNGADSVKRSADVPIIAFSFGTHHNWEDLVATGANVVGIDWQISLTEARKHLPATVALQGNLEPKLLSDATPDAVAREASLLLTEMRGRPGHIFNLGHGVPPTAKLENIAALVETVRNFK
jgi:uroporphyrinogen decarboxylase